MVQNNSKVENENQNSSVSVHIDIDVDNDASEVGEAGDDLEDVEKKKKKNVESASRSNENENENEKNGKETKKKKKIEHATLKRILILAKPDFFMLFWASIALFLASAGNLLLPLFAGYVIGDITAIANVTVVQKNAILDRIRFNTLLLFGILGLSALLGFVRRVLFTLVGERVVNRLRLKLFNKLVDMDISFFDGRKSGELLNRLSSDCTTLSNTSSVNLSMFLRFSVQTIAGTVILFFISWKLTLIMLSCVPVVAIGASIFGRWVRSVSKDAQDALAEAGEAAQQAFSGIRTVRVFNGEEREKENYSEEIGKYYLVAKKRAFSIGYFAAIVSLAGGGCICACLYAGAYFVLEGEMKAGDLISFILYTFTLFAGLATLSGLYADVMKAMGASERVFELLNMPKSINQRFGAKLEWANENKNDIENNSAIELENIGSSSTTATSTTSQSESPMHAIDINIDNVTFSYPTRPTVKVLRDVTIDIGKGEVVALVGPSGAGKSTISHLIERLYDVENGLGTVLFGGKDVRDLDPIELRKHIGVVSQEPILFATTILENIRYGCPSATLEQVAAAAKDANALDFIEKMPLKFDTVVGERGVQLSGGQKQRIAIARAVITNPEVLLLDEATSALDAESDFLVQEALDRLMVSRTSLVIAHRFTTIQRAHKVVVLDDGKVVECGTHKELIELNGVYKALINRQILS